MTASSLSASLSAHALTHPLRLPLPYSASLAQMPYEVLLLNTAGGTWRGTDSFGPEQAHGRMAKKRKATTGSWRASSFPLSSTGAAEARRSRLGPTDTAVCDSSSLNLRRSYRMPRLHYWFLSRASHLLPQSRVSPSIPQLWSAYLTSHPNSLSSRAHLLALSDP
ncbi:hypothetical protein CABS01_03394 [Colletotrichum abscissum]|uniref:uncharacterized protein n=1 Tax=Colletotrichum abscissum TaxID=1671311 RepID=UPI0027D50D6A|nr:uncharacterized protein CABS01_03394 [Colletotrichum abscissum]KAK1478092.1 hypothetical protein CABS01_03394 [Colletotrichum abscissum]